eukprot:1142362-Pelagomonas_calceolata.AAC.3
MFQLSCPRRQALIEALEQGRLGGVGLDVHWLCLQRAPCAVPVEQRQQCSPCHYALLGCSSEK